MQRSPAPIGYISRPGNHSGNMRHGGSDRLCQMRQMKICIIHVEQDRLPGIKLGSIQRMTRALHNDDVRRSARQKAVALRQGKLPGQNQCAPSKIAQVLGHLIDSQKRRTFRPISRQEYRHWALPRCRICAECTGTSRSRCATGRKTALIESERWTACGVDIGSTSLNQG